MGGQAGKRDLCAVGKGRSAGCSCIGKEVGKGGMENWLISDF